MRVRKYTVLFGLFVACLVFDAWIYGSLAGIPETGPELASAAHAHSPLLHAYIVLGSPLAAHTGASGQYVSSAAFGAAFPAMRESPAAADSLLFSQSHGPLRGILVLLFWAAPALLVLTLAAWALRSRPTHLMGRAR
ncbi:MAG TPA: hypothetical protein VFW60_07120 [Rhodanobacteraceae bacterium]|nr:hypothetical protein [Rhodanobacteraceae bacterium]